MKKSTLLFVALIFLYACTDKNKIQQEEHHKEVVRFFKSFSPLEKPFDLVTDVGSLSIFNALMSEHFSIDSTLSSKFAFNADQHEDSLQKAASTEHFNYYNMGKVGETEKYYAVLYGRNSSVQDDAYVFLATFDKEGNKIDEVIFHKPLLELPPIEVKQDSKLTTDSTFSIITVTEEHEFVDKKGQYMELIKQIAHQKNYKIEANGKIELVSSENQELSAQEVAQKQTEEQKEVKKEDPKPKSFKVKPN